MFTGQAVGAPLKMHVLYWNEVVISKPLHPLHAHVTQFLVSQLTGTKNGNGGCTIVSISGRERRQAEERLRACGALSHDEEIREAMEAISFDDTLGVI